MSNCGNKERFKQPLQNGNCLTKIESFNELLADGEDIAVTHTTFLNATTKTMDLIKQGEYTLVIDEVIEVITDFNDLQSIENSPHQMISSADLQILIDKKMITIDETNRLIISLCEMTSRLKAA